MGINVKGCLCVCVWWRKRICVLSYLFHLCIWTQSIIYTWIYVCPFCMCMLYFTFAFIFCVCFCPCQPLTAMPECSQTPRRQRPEYLADFTSGSSAENSCSSSDEEEEERRKTGEGGRGGEKREKKVSYDLGESKEKNLAERSGKAAGCIKVSKNVFY